MKDTPPPNLDKVVARYWAAGFPGRPLATITTDLPPPFDRCEFQAPVNGRPLHEYLATHRDVATQQRIGVALGSLAAWLNRVPIDPAITPARDEHSRDVHVHRDEHLARLHRCGLDAEQSNALLQHLTDLWRTQPPLALCHDDLYPQHILVSDDGTLGVIDWEDLAPKTPSRTSPSGTSRSTAWSGANSIPWRGRPPAAPTAPASPRRTRSAA